MEGCVQGGRANLRRLTRALKHGRAVPSDCARWFVQAVDRFQAGEDDLIAALALTASAAKQARNAHLVEAGRMIGEDVPATERATMIRRTGAQLENFIEAPDEIEPHLARRWELEVFRALQNAPLPSQSAIRQLMP